MSQDHPPPTGERPRSEPEIIPPPPGPRWRLDDEAWTNTSSMGDPRRTQRIYIARISPFSLALLLIAIGVLAALVVIFFIGLVVFWIPVIAVLVAAALGYARLRRYFLHR